MGKRLDYILEFISYKRLLAVMERSTDITVFMHDGHLGHHTIGFATLASAL